jgi:hypothetical protein
MVRLFGNKNNKHMGADEHMMADDPISIKQSKTTGSYMAPSLIESFLDDSDIIPIPPADNHGATTMPRTRTEQSAAVVDDPSVLNQLSKVEILNVQRVPTEKSTLIKHYSTISSSSKEGTKIEMERIRTEESAVLDPSVLNHMNEVQILNVKRVSTEKSLASTKSSMKNNTMLAEVNEERDENEQTESIASPRSMDEHRSTIEVDIEDTTSNKEEVAVVVNQNTFVPEISEEVASEEERGQPEQEDTKSTSTSEVAAPEPPFLSPKALPARRNRTMLPLQITRTSQIAHAPSMEKALTNVSPIKTREHSIFNAFSFSGWTKTPTVAGSPRVQEENSAIGDVESNILGNPSSQYDFSTITSMKGTVAQSAITQKVANRMPSFRHSGPSMLNPAPTDQDESLLAMSTDFDQSTFMGGDQSTAMGKDDMTVTTSFTKLPILEEVDTDEEQPYWNMDRSLSKNHLIEWRQAAEEGPIPVRVSAFSLALASIGTVTATLVLEESWMFSNIILAMHTAFFACLILILEGKSCFDRDNANPRAKLRDILTKYVRLFKYLWGRGIFYIFVGSLNMAVDGSYVLCTGVPLVLLGIGSIIAGVVYANRLDRLKSSLTFEVFLWNYFHECDHDQDDYINCDQFGELMRSLGMDFDDDYLSRAFQQIIGPSSNGDSLVSFEQFKQWWINTQNGGEPQTFA